MSRRIRWYIGLIDLSLPSLSTGPIKTCVFFFVACVILRIIFKFRFSQYACLCEQVGFLLKWSHMAKEIFTKKQAIFTQQVTVFF